MAGKQAIDENLLRNLMAGDSYKPPASLPESEPENEKSTDEKEERTTDKKESTTKRKKGQTDYIGTYLKPSSLKERQGVYISREHLEIISKIVNLLGTKELTFGVYIENVLAEHFTLYQDEINTLIEKKYSKLIDK